MDLGIIPPHHVDVGLTPSPQFAFSATKMGLGGAHGAMRALLGCLLVAWVTAYQHFAIVIDAGSTGCRLYVYQTDIDGEPYVQTCLTSWRARGRQRRGIPSPPTRGGNAKGWY